MSEITAALLQRGAIVVADTDAATREGSGRPAERLVLDPDSGQFLGVDFGHRRVYIAVADASHTVFAEGSVRYPDGTAWSERIRLAMDRIDTLSQETGVHFGALQGIGIGVPGPYLADSPGMPAASWTHRLAPEGVESAFTERFGAPVVIDNNTRLAALAEALARPDVVEDLLYVRLSDGVGGGLVVSGRLVTGSRGFAGEIGHVTADPSGSLCRCGKRGCLETIACVPAIFQACRDAGSHVDDLDDLARAVQRGEPAVDAVLREVGAAIGRALGAAAMVLNPEEVVIGGDIAHVAPVIVDQAAATLRYELYSVPSDQPQVVRAAQLRDSDGAFGAVAAVFHQSPLLAGYPDLPPAERADPSRRRSVQ
ncbi:ROK family protein [Serinicoccus sp. LYQ131]|uniref:ROK family protein n=1 Tax=Serinicoccus sp. LYQ131 TaxID=3378797 RepID=UPI003852798B